MVHCVVCRRRMYNGRTAISVDSYILSTDSLYMMIRNIQKSDEKRRRSKYHTFFLYTSCPQKV